MILHTNVETSDHTAWGSATTNNTFRINNGYLLQYNCHCRTCPKRDGLPFNI